MPSDKAVGMMNEAYFVGRKELLAWINTVFKLNYDKVEQTCTGAVHCQIMDALHPGVVPLSKVNFNAKHDYEYIKNYKILQTVFSKLNIEKVIDINKLIKGKYQDNLEFLQWMKRYWDINWQGGEYDASSRRTNATREYEVNKGGNQPTPVPQQPSPTPAPSNIIRPALAPKNTSNPTPPPQNKPVQQQPNVTNAAAIEQKVLLLGKKVEQLKQKKEALGKERDFYFDKLRQIEIKCEALENQQRSGIDACVFAKEIQEILYATSDNPE